VILTAPTLSAEDKASIVKELLKTAGSDNETLRNFLKTLSENNRLGALEGVAEKFALLMGAHRGEVEMRVTSAAPLDAKVLKQLETAVGKSKLAQGKKLKVVPKVSFEPVGVFFAKRTVIGALDADPLHRCNPTSAVDLSWRSATGPLTSASRPRWPG